MSASLIGAPDRAFKSLKVALRSPISDALSYAEVYARQTGRCYLCGQALRRPGNWRQTWPRQITREHVFPKSRRGLGRGLAHVNELLAHRRCNQRKADRWPYPCEIIYLASVYAERPAPRRRAA